MKGPAGLLAGLLCGPVLAACPEPGDLAYGITIDFDLQVITYSATAPDRVSSRLQTRDGLLQSVTDLAWGMVPLAVTADFADPALPDQRTAYDLTPAELAGQVPPPPGQSLTIDTVLRDLERGGQEAVVITLTSGQPGRVTVGDCALAVLPVSVAFDRPGNHYVAEALWLPDFGFSFVTRRRLADGMTETIRPLAISGP